MLVPVFLSFIWCANAYTPLCTDKGDTPMTFRPTEDGVVGRYRAELCTRRNPNVTEWQIDLLYYDTPQYCSSNWTAGRRRRPGHEHSVDTLQIEDSNNCTHVCYSMDLDLIFSSCYLIKSTMITGDIKMPPNDTFHMITNHLTIESIKGNKPFVNYVNHNNEVSLTWYLGIPPTDCKVSLCQTKNVTGEAIPNACEGDLLDVTSNCTRDELHNELRCVFAPPYGGYRALVQHGAPWTTGVFIKQQYTRYEFMHAPVSPPRVAAGAARAVGAAAAWWACGGALVLAAAALAAVAARRELRRCAYYKHILSGRRPPRQESEPPSPPPPPPPPGEGEAAAAGEGPVLVLYAREGERGQRVVDRLVELLQQAIAAPVWDVHGARAAALGARAPHEWARGALAARGVRVLLLQTPALAALYRAHTPTDAGFKLAEPLLGRRVVYRAPQFADALLQYALRLLAGDAPAHHAYHKYYLATLTELPTDIFPQVVPFTRYPLPHAAAALLRDLAPASPAAPAPAPHLLQQLEEAVEQFVSHATEHPNYLMEELLVIANN